jgi:gamma-glutamylcyclotransferase (GGCT)/AIG2-like uncharacterized protein YtfP
MKMSEIIMEAGAMPIYYFAYGMLTDPDHMPGAELIGAATLNNFQFELLAHANVHPEAGAQAMGVLWAIDRQLLGQLDRIEGYPHYYDRKTVPVICDGQRYEAEVYTMTPESRQHSQGRPASKSYINTLAKGYRNAGIPLTQISNAFQRDQIAANEPR